MVERTGEGDDGSIGSYWATSDIWLSPPEDEKAPMPELSLSAEIVVGEQNSMRRQNSKGISKSKLKQGWDFLRTNQKAARPKKKKKPGPKPSKPDKAKRIKKVLKRGRTTEKKSALKKKTSSREKEKGKEKIKVDKLGFFSE